MEKEDLGENFINERLEIDAPFVTQLNGSNREATEAITEIYRSYFPPLVQYAYTLIKDRVESIDIVSSVFLSLWRTKDQFLIVRDINSYLYSCVRHACFHYSRSDKIRKENSIRYFYSEVSNTFDNEEISPEIMKILYEEIENLPSQQKQIIKLFLLDESTAEIAAKMQITTKTVHNQRLNAINSLQAKLLKRNIKSVRFPSTLLIMF